MFPPPPSLLILEILTGPPRELVPAVPSHLLPLCTFCGHSRTRHVDHGRCLSCDCQEFRMPECEVCPHPRLDHPLVPHPRDVDEAGDPVLVHGPCGVPECLCANYVTVTLAETVAKR